MARAPSHGRLRPRAAAAPAAAQDKYFSKVVGKALAALDEIRAASSPRSLDDLTKRIGLAKTSLFRILHTLETAGYLERDHAGRYRAPTFLRPDSTFQVRQTLVARARPHMAALNREFGETSSLAMRFEHHLEVIAVVESAQLIRMGNTVGRILPPHASSLGKVLLAFQPKDDQESLVRGYGLHRFTPHTLVDAAELERELEMVRQRGYSTDAEESVLEGCCFGAPVHGADGSVIAALSLSLPKMRLASEDRRRKIVAALRRAADAISADLGAPPAAARRAQKRRG